MYKIFLRFSIRSGPSLFAITNMSARRLLYESTPDEALLVSCY